MLADEIMQELAVYQALANNFKFSSGNFQEQAMDIMQFWEINQLSIPNWSKAYFASIAILIASSAPAERLISIFSGTIGDQQTSMLESTLEASILFALQFDLINSELFLEWKFNYLFPIKLRWESYCSK